MKEDPHYSDPNAISVLKVRQWMNELSSQSNMAARRPDTMLGQSQQVGYGNMQRDLPDFMNAHQAHLMPDMQHGFVDQVQVVSPRSILRSMNASVSR